MAVPKGTSRNPYVTQSYHNFRACVDLARQFIFVYKNLAGKVRTLPLLQVMCAMRTLH